jgi:hypothetical protein
MEGGNRTFAAVMIKGGAADFSAIYRNYLNTLRRKNAAGFRQ